MGYNPPPPPRPPIEARIARLHHWHRIWDEYGVDWERDDLITAYLDKRLPFHEVEYLRDTDGRLLFPPRELIGLV